MPTFSLSVPLKFLLNGMVTSGLVIGVHIGTYTDGKGFEAYQIRSVDMLGADFKVSSVYLYDGVPMPTIGTQFTCTPTICLVPVIKDMTPRDPVAPPPILPVPKAP